MKVPPGLFSGKPVGWRRFNERVVRALFTGHTLSPGGEGPEFDRCGPFVPVADPQDEYLTVAVAGLYAAPAAMTTGHRRVLEA